MSIRLRCPTGARSWGDDAARHHRLTRPDSSATGTGRTTVLAVEPVEDIIDGAPLKDLEARAPRRRNRSSGMSGVLRGERNPEGVPERGNSVGIGSVSAPSPVSRRAISRSMARSWSPPRAEGARTISSEDRRRRWPRATRPDRTHPAPPARAAKGSPNSEKAATGDREEGVLAVDHPAQDGGVASAAALDHEPGANRMETFSVSSVRWQARNRVRSTSGIAPRSTGCPCRRGSTHRAHDLRPA